MKLTIDKDHIYRYGEKEIPSVTQILSNGQSNPYVTERGLERGSNVHAAIAAFTQDVLMRNPTGKETVNIDGEETEYFSQALQFLSTCEDVLACEKPLMCPEMMYAGTLDLVVKLNGRVWICDFKLNNIYDSTWSQLSAYANLWNVNQRHTKNLIQKRGAVKLTRGSFRLVDAESRPEHKNDWPKFLKAHGEYNDKSRTENLCATAES
jgi:RecJ-like exonuclease